MFRLTSTAATDNVNEPVLRKFVHPISHFFWGLCVLTEFIGQSSIGIADNGDVSHFRHLGKVGTNLLGTKTTVQPDGKQIRVPNGVPKSLNCLSRKISAATAAPIRRDNERNVDASCFSEGLYGEECRFTVKRIHDGFDEEEIGTAIN